jgi:hypothetical protein
MPATQMFKRRLIPVIGKKMPVLVEDRMTLFDGGKLLFCSVILPLSSDQKQIDYLLGGANGKISAD